MAIDKDYLMSLSVDDALRAEIERLRAALEPFTKVGRDLVRVGASVIPDGASANRLKLDGIYAKHFREAAIAFGYEQSTEGKMTTALNAMMAQDSDILAAKRFADHMIHLLRDYIPEASRRDAWELLAKTAHDEKFELTTWAMRKQYEAWKDTQLDVLNFGNGQSPK